MGRKHAVSGESSLRLPAAHVPCSSSVPARNIVAARAGQQTRGGGCCQVHRVPVVAGGDGVGREGDELSQAGGGVRLPKRPQPEDRALAVSNSPRVRADVGFC